jgi:hypothetical protein
MVGLEHSTVKPCWTVGGDRGQQESPPSWERLEAGDSKNVFMEGNKHVLKAAAGDMLIRHGHHEDKEWGD